MNTAMEIVANLLGYKQKRRETAFDVHESNVKRISAGAKIPIEDLARDLEAAGKTEQDLVADVAVAQDRKRWLAESKGEAEVKAEQVKIEAEMKKHSADYERARQVFVAAKEKYRDDLARTNGRLWAIENARQRLQETAPRVVRQFVESLDGDATSLGQRIGHLRELLATHSAQYINADGKVVPNITGRLAEARANIAEAKTGKRSGSEAALKTWEANLARIQREESAARKELADLAAKLTVIQSRQADARKAALVA